MEHNNLLFQIADHDLGNFFIMNKEIFLRTDDKDKGLISLEARGLLATLLTLNGIPWDFSKEGLAKICGCSIDKLNRVLKELTKHGYFQKLNPRRNELGQIEKYYYKVFETAENKWWQVSELDSDLPHEVNLNEVNLNEVNQGQYNIEINQDKKEYNIEINQDIGKQVSEGEQKDKFNNINNESINTCNMDSLHNSTISDKINSHDLNGKISGLTNLNNSKSSFPKISKTKKPSKCVKGVIDGKECRNKAQINDAQEKVGVEKLMEEQNGIKAGEQTKEEKILAQTKKNADVAVEAAKEAKAHEYAIKNTKKTRKNSITETIEREVADTDLKEALINYFTFYVESGKPIQIQNYQMMMKTLENLSKGDVAMKVAIVEQSLEKCWLGFYELKDKSKLRKKQEFIQPKPTNNGEKTFKNAARDENGNVKVYR